MWHPLPDFLVVSALLTVLLGYLGVLGVLMANPWVGRTVRTWPGQRIVTAGPCALVRHPMHTAFLFFILATPTAPGSLSALIPAVSIFHFLVWRILSEERALTQAFPEYVSYLNKVRYRLLPGVWEGL